MFSHQPHPRVTVVVPAFNAERTLRDTLSSVAEQTLAEFEVKIVDDGSTDRTRAIAGEFSARDSRFQVLRQSNSGIARARNTGLRAAAARYVAPLDADDIWHPTYLAKLVGALDAAGPEAVLAYANSRIIDPSGYVLDSAPAFEESGWVLNRLLVRNFIGNGSAAVFRRDVALQAGGYDPRLQHEFSAQGAEDWLLALRLAAGGRFVAVSEYLVGYRATPNNMSSDTLRMRRSRVHALELLFAAVRCGHLRAARWALGEAQGKCFLHQFRDRRLYEASKSLTAALRLDALGTVDLLFGANRLRWVRDELVANASRSSRRFKQYEPSEDRSKVILPRLDSARDFDALGPALGTARVSKSLHPSTEP